MFDHLPAPKWENKSVTFSEPSEGESYAQTAARLVYKAGYGAVYDFATKPEAYGDILSSAERSTRLTGHAFSELSAREEAYDARIAAAKMFAGVDLENPERGGYAPEARQAIRETIRQNGWQPIEETGGVRAYQQSIFDEKWKALQQEHADNPEIQKFVDIDEEGKAAARIAADENARLMARDDVNPVAGFVASIPGSIWGMRRDPLFVASLFAGPTSAIGKTALARIGTSAMFQGAYNAGLSAIEQPVVQDWRSQIGLQSGVVPALEEVGMAFLFGAIIGAPLRAVHEAFTPHAPAVQRILNDAAEPGDVAAAVKAVGGELTPEQAAVVRVGEDAIKADAVAFADPPMPAGRAADLESIVDSMKQEFPKLAPFLDNFRADLTTSAEEGRQRIILNFGWLNDAQKSALLKTFDDKVDFSALPGGQKNLHDDLTRAALRHAEDPAEPPPQVLMAEQAIEAFHGSPHSFDRFDVTRIGTGEGVQAYGRGLYFAEHEGVATRYRDRLTVGASAMDQTSLTYLAKANGDKVEAKRMLREALGDLPDTHPVIKAIDREGEGALYKVRINANRENFIDLDKTLNEQPPQVQEGIKRAMGIDYYGNFDPEKSARLWNEFQGSNGKTAVRQGFIAADDQLVAERLRDAGIPGLKYLDERSRGTGDGTRNFVVFDDKNVEITHRNDQPLSPQLAEVQRRVQEARPETQAEARAVAAEVMEEQGNRATVARLESDLAQKPLPAPIEAQGEAVRPSATRASKEPIDQIPWLRDDGSATTISREALARQGEREAHLAELVRACK